MPKPATPGTGVPRPRAITVSRRLAEIHRQVAVLREHPHAPLGAHRDARGGDRRHRAVDEADARIGDVGVLAGHRRADRIDALDLARHQRQDQVEVVDHQVEDHRHVGAALLERRDAGGLDVERRAQPALHCGEGGGKTFQMADLQYQPCASRPVAASSSACASVAAIGFSTSTCLPARSASAASAWCASAGAAITSASLAASSVAKSIAGAPASQPTVLARSASGSNTPTSVARVGRGDLQRVIAAEMADTGDADTEW